MAAAPPQLAQLARRYVWWRDAEQALEREDDFLCQLMQLGTFEDVRLARRLLGDQAFKRALSHAAPGIFDRKSWNFWHLFFGLTPVPPMPVRNLPWPSSPS